MDQLEKLDRVNELLRMIDIKKGKVMNQFNINQKLTPSQINILLLLHEKGALKVSDISTILKMENSNVSAICSRLEKIHFIERIRLKEDKRVVKIQLTESAKKEMHEVLASIQKCHQLISQFSSNEELGEIIMALSKLDTLFENVLHHTKKDQGIGI